MSERLKSPEGRRNESSAELTVIVVSYNTRELTIQALRTLFENSGNVRMDVIVWDNASEDGSADAIEEAFPSVRLIRSHENIGFARANNAAAIYAKSKWLLLLNPDTETHPGAIANLLHFAQENPQAGIVGGRTVFPDGSLNAASCWQTISLWSLFCSALGLSWLFSRSRLFNPEAMPDWPRNSVRHVDVVVGCFLMISTELWRKLGGFRPEYIMYGEEHDLCLRAARLGYRPMITPDAEIMHIVGASTSHRPSKLMAVRRARATLIRHHWAPARAAVGLRLMWLGVATRYLGAMAISRATGRSELAATWREIWSQRREWLSGY